MMRTRLSKRREPRNYEVGFGRPPKHSRFVKGKSGNPNGRPKVITNLDERIESELNVTISVEIGGKNVTLTKREAIVRQLLNSAAKGNIRALKFLLDQERVRDPRPKKAGWIVRYLNPDGSEFIPSRDRK